MLATTKGRSMVLPSPYWYLAETHWAKTCWRQVGVANAMLKFRGPARDAYAAIIRRRTLGTMCATSRYRMT
jgi:hypothetical protein